MSHMATHQQAHECSANALRLHAGGLSWDAIAQHLGYASPASACGCARYETLRQRRKILDFPVRMFWEDQDEDDDDFFPWPPAS